MIDLRIHLAARLESQQRVDFLAVLLRVARADDISPAERDRLGPVAGWIGADEEELTQALQRADDSSVLLAELARSVEALPDRLLLFRECCAVAWVDGRCSADEERLLDHLSLLLGISEAARHILDSALACSPEGERRFLEYLETTEHETRGAFGSELGDGGTSPT